MDEEQSDHHGDSGDYTRFGIPDAPRATVTTAFGKVNSIMSIGCVLQLLQEVLQEVLVFQI